MKRTLSLLLITLFFLPSLACAVLTTNAVRGSGDIITQTFDVGNLDQVTLEGFGTVFIEQGQTESLSVQTDDNIMSLLDIRVRGRELTLGVKRGYDITPSRSITFHVTVKDLSAVTVDGSGDFYIEPIKSDRLAVYVMGSGNIDIKGLTADELSMQLNGSGNISIQDISAKNIDTSLQGSGDIELEGTADIENVTVNGSGNYRAGELETSSAEINIPGSAEVTVWASDDLEVRINGSGNVSYYGRPAIDQSGSGSGSLISLGDK